MQFKESPQATGQVSTLAGIVTHRRPGRKAQVNPHLIPLLRSPTAMDIPAPIGGVDVPPLKDDLSPIRGVTYSLILSIPLWGGVAGALWEMLR